MVTRVIDDLVLVHGASGSKSLLACTFHLTFQNVTENLEHTHLIHINIHQKPRDSIKSTKLTIPSFALFRYTSCPDFPPVQRTFRTHARSPPVVCQAAHLLMTRRDESPRLKNYAHSTNMLTELATSWTPTEKHNIKLVAKPYRSTPEQRI